MSFYDKYNIEASEIISSVGREESQVNLSLTESPDIDSGSVAGTVLDTDGNPVPNAIVKLNTADLQPYDHTNTNPQGKFIFTNVPTGSYLTAAVKEGYLLPIAISLTVAKNKTTNITITISPDPNATKNIIFGIVNSNIDNQPIDQAHVALYQQQTGAEDVFLGMSSTNQSGQYYFVDLDDGVYYVKATKSGYYPTDSAPVDLSSKEYSSLDVSLVSDASANTGVICGIITDKATGLPIENSAVALYSISSTGVETLIQLTKTSIEGKYLFGEILPGDYRVKATLQIEE